MKNSYIATIAALGLSFSVFCFCYLNNYNQTILSSNAVDQTVSAKIEQETEEEIYFPDLFLLERISKAALEVIKSF